MTAQKAHTARASSGVDPSRREIPDATAYLESFVGHFRCALPVADVLELHRAVAVTPLPGTPDVVDGAVDVRGTVLGVLSARTRLGAPPRAVAPSDVFIHLRLHDRDTLLRVDGVGRIVELTGDMVVDPPADADDPPHVTGLARTPDGMLVIVDTAAFLDADESAVVDAALREVDV